MKVVNPCLVVFREKVWYSITVFISPISQWSKLQYYSLRSHHPSFFHYFFEPFETWTFTLFYLENLEWGVSVVRKMNYKVVKESGTCGFAVWEHIDLFLSPYSERAVMDWFASKGSKHLHRPRFAQFSVLQAVDQTSIIDSSGLGWLPTSNPFIIESCHCDSQSSVTFCFLRLETWSPLECAFHSCLSLSLSLSWVSSFFYHLPSLDSPIKSVPRDSKQNNKKQLTKQ